MRYFISAVLIFFSATTLANETKRLNALEKAYLRLGSVNGLIKLLLPYLSESDLAYLKQLNTTVRFPKSTVLGDQIQLSAEGEFVRVGVMPLGSGKIKINGHEWKVSWPLQVEKDLRTIDRFLQTKHAGIGDLIFPRALADWPVLSPLTEPIYALGMAVAASDCWLNTRTLACHEGATDNFRYCGKLSAFWPEWYSQKFDSEDTDWTFYPNQIECVGKNIKSAEFINDDGVTFRWTPDKKDPHKFMLATFNPWLKRWNAGKSVEFTDEGKVKCLEGAKQVPMYEEPLNSYESMLSTAKEACADPVLKKEFNEEGQTTRARLPKDVRDLIPAQISF